jgi:hypothetical protein
MLTEHGASNLWIDMVEHESYDEFWQQRCVLASTIVYSWRYLVLTPTQPIYIQPPAAAAAAAVAAAAADWTNRRGQGDPAPPQSCQLRRFGGRRLVRLRGSTRTIRRLRRYISGMYETERIN